MSFLMEGRVSDSPYVEMIWRGRAGSDYTALCPADGCWNLVFLRRNGSVRVSAEGPITKAKSKTLAEDTEWLVIKFRLGTFLPVLPVRDLLVRETVLSEAASPSFWLHSSSWQLPDYENVEIFVERLVRDEVLLRDPIVPAVLLGQPLSSTRWASVTVPTLVMDGGKSPVWMRHAMHMLAQTLPHATYRTLEGQTHMVKPEVLASMLEEFFTSENDGRSEKEQS